MMLIYYKICTEESIYLWYGNGGDWINLGLPMYVVIDLMPDNGKYIQDTACNVAGIMIRLKTVK